MANQPAKFELRLGDLVHTNVYGQALLVGAVDGGGTPSTFIIATEKNEKVVFTLVTQEDIQFKYEPSARLLRIKQASFGTDVLAATLGTGGAGH